MKPPRHPPDIARILAASERVPHCRALGMRVVELRHGYGLMTVPYAKTLVGNPETGVVHGGVTTALLDTLGALVVMSSVPEGTSIATLDLRIDYLRPGAAEHDVFASAECYKVTSSVAFVRGLAYQETFRDPLAHCAGTYMLGGTGFDPTRAGEPGGSP